MRSNANAGSATKNLNKVTAAMLVIVRWVYVVVRANGRKERNLEHWTITIELQRRN